MNVKVDFENPVIKYISVQCDSCSKWFNGKEITENNLKTSEDIKSAQFECPLCGHIFGADSYNNFATLKITECDSDEVFKNCYSKKVCWKNQNEDY
ncbi:MAG: hypothetical protein WCR54_08910 [Clostridia bacterium]